MPDFKEKHLDFVMKYYRKGAMDTQLAIEKFMRNNGLSRPEKKGHRQWIYALSAVAAALVAGAFLWNLYMRQTVVLEAGSQLAEYVLPDQTRIEIEQGGRLEYPKHRFGKKSRKVKMDGLIFFEVAKDPSRTFEITAGTSIVRVLGTQFQVDTRSGEPTTHVLEGKVYMGRKDQEDGIILTAGMKATLPQDKALPQLCDRPDPNELVWHTHRFVFHETPLSQVLTTLSDYYRTPLRSPDADSADKKLTGEFEVESLDVILHLIETALDVRIYQQK